MPTLIDTQHTDFTQFCSLGTAVIDAEIQAIQALKARIDASFSAACQHILNSSGRVIVIGMGKSGHIGNKIASTLASTGTPAFFVHPGEASHGDMGMITANDVVIAISNSGKTPEIMTILPLLKRLATPLITLTGNPTSPIAQAATVNLDVSVEKEACPLGLAPTSSTTAALVMGDALAIALLETRGFTEEDFALSHPGGALGRKLLLRIDEIMHVGNAAPQVTPDTILSDALIEITQKGFGMTAVVDDHQKIIGIFTDGDLRRVMDKNLDVHKTPISEVMTTHCITIQPGLLAAEALRIMEDNKITGLIITNEHEQVIGALHMHDLLRAGVV